MTDNIDVTPGSGKTVAADEIVGVLHQRVKVSLGADGVNDGDVSSSNPMPVTGSITALTTMPTTLVSFVTTNVTAGVPTQLAPNTVTNGFILQAPSTNTGIIYVGGATVSATVFGAELQPGQATSVAIDNTNKIYIDSSVSGDKCSALGS